MADPGLPADATWGALTFSEQFLLWAIRMWAQLSDDPVRANDFISPAFDRVGAKGTGPLFHSFMCGVTASARRRIEVRCPRSSEICDDELGLMRTLYACQQDLSGIAHVQLGGLVHEDAIRHIIVHGTLLMRACLREGILLRPVPAVRDWPAAPRLEEHAACAAHPGATIH